ncbi:MAG: MFS transporter [Armatimonadetes bacterium]|nr:MFS transporter [Armatimonadota bacterium]
MDAIESPNPRQEPPKRLSVVDQLALSAFWAASNFVWGALIIILVPAQVEQMVGANKGPVMGLALGVGAIAALLIPLIVGPLSDRCIHRLGRRRPYMFVGVTLNLAGLAMIYFSGLAGNIYAYLGSYFLMTVGNNIATAAFSGVIPDLVPEEQRGEASGYMAVMSQIGTVIGILVASFLPKTNAYFASYFFLGLGLTVGLVVSMIGIKERRLASNLEPINWATYMPSLVDPFRSMDFRWVWITRALVMYGFYSFVPLLQYYLADVIKVESPEQATAIISVCVILFAAISGYFGGKLSDRLGRKKIVYWANGFMAFMCVVFIFCRTLEQVIGAGILFGLGYGAYISVDWALGTDVLPSKDDAAKDMAVWHISMTLPQAMAAYPAGLLVKSFGVHILNVGGEMVNSYTVKGYAAVFVVSAFALALGAYLLRNVRGAR